MNERQRARSPDIGNEDEGLKGRVELQMKDADQALQTLGDLEQEHVEPTRAVSRRLLWKIDLIILPVA